MISGSFLKSLKLHFVILKKYTDTVCDNAVGAYETAHCEEPATWVKHGTALFVFP